MQFKHTYRQNKVRSALTEWWILSNDLTTKGLIGCPHLPSARPSAYEKRSLFGWRSCSARLSTCKECPGARLRRYAGIERIPQARPARCAVSVQREKGDQL